MKIQCIELLTINNNKAMFINELFCRKRKLKKSVLLQLNLNAFNYFDNEFEKSHRIATK